MLSLRQHHLTCRNSPVGGLPCAGAAPVGERQCCCCAAAGFVRRRALSLCPCCRCGQLGHLTKQGRNQFSRFFDGGPGAEKDAAQQAAAAAGVPTAAIAMAPLAAHAGGRWYSC